MSRIADVDSGGVPGGRFIGPRGTLVQYVDGSYGLFFSGGNCGDGDSDAYHYVGYAHSPDAVNWTVDNCMSNPLVGVDYASRRPARPPITGL